MYRSYSSPINLFTTFLLKSKKKLKYFNKFQTISKNGQVNKQASDLLIISNGTAEIS